MTSEGDFASEREEGSAVLSSDRAHRYHLAREPLRPAVIGAATRPVLFVMLNPSTADALDDDATIRRCRRFAASWGYGGIAVVNLFSLLLSHAREAHR